jgi:zinc transport system permease protein
MPVEWLTSLLDSTATSLGTHMFMVKSVVAIVLVCLLCGSVGAIVVGNRMAFFSDAMAHCAFAGVTLGYLSVVLSGAGRDSEKAAWVVPLVMIAFGAAVGAAMVYVREKTNLAHDTVIGVFFALAIGFGAMLFKVLQQVSTFSPEGFLFGAVYYVSELDLLFLVALLLVTAALFAWRYNEIVFASFNPSLARTRRVPIRLNNYLFIILLALVVNLSIRAVGALLINALLVVPAAAAANLSRNLRQMFWLTILFSLTAGLVGFWVSLNYGVKVDRGDPVKFGASGTIVVTAVALFFLSMFFAAAKSRFGPVLRPGHSHPPGEA